MKLVIADDAIATLRIGGRFKATDPENFVQALEARFGVRAVRVPLAGVIVLMNGKRAAGSSLLIHPPFSHPRDSESRRYHQITRRIDAGSPASVMTTLTLKLRFT